MIDSISVHILTALTGSTGTLVYKLLRDFLAKKLAADEDIAQSTDLDKLANQLGRAEQNSTPEEVLSVARDILHAAHGASNGIREERERQAKLTFNTAITLCITGVLIIFAGIGLLFWNPDIYSGIITVAVGAVTEVISALLFRLNKETNDRLDKVATETNIIEKSQIAIEVASKIEDPVARDATIREVAIGITK